VLAFFAQHDIVDRISDEPKAVNLLLRSNGRPSGQAVVHMRNKVDAELAHQKLMGQWMGSRYIEIFLCHEDGTDCTSPTNGAGGSSPGSMGGASPGAATSLAAVSPPGVGTALGAAGGAGLAQNVPTWPPVPAATWGAMGTSFASSAAAGAASWEALLDFLGPQGMAAMAEAAARGGVPPALPTQTAAANSTQWREAGAAAPTTPM